MVLNCTAILGREQPGMIGWILLWIMAHSSQWKPDPDWPYYAEDPEQCPHFSCLGTPCKLPGDSIAPGSDSTQQVLVKLSAPFVTRYKRFSRNGAPKRRRGKVNCLKLNGINCSSHFGVVLNFKLHHYFWYESFLCGTEFEATSIVQVKRMVL